MADILLFHHAQGRTAGVLAFADELRSAGHVVHTPDLYGGRTFSELADGVGYAQEVGLDAIIRRGANASEGLPHDILYGGFSLGTLPAQRSGWFPRDAARRGALRAFARPAAAPGRHLLTQSGRTSRRGWGCAASRG